MDLDYCYSLIFSKKLTQLSKILEFYLLLRSKRQKIILARFMTLQSFSSEQLQRSMQYLLRAEKD